MVSELTLSVRQIAATVRVSQQLLDDAPLNIFAVIAQRQAISAAQGGKCWATTTRRRRCSRTWRVILDERGYCRQHAKAHT